MENEKTIFTAIGVVIAAFLVIIALVALNPITIVGAGERGVVLNWSAFKGQIFEPGIHFRMPIVQHVVKMDVRTQKLEIEKSEAYSKDLQVVDVHSVLNYYVDPQSTGYVYQQYNINYETKILSPNMEAAIKQTVAQYTAEELLVKRGEVQSKITEAIKVLLPKEFIVSGYAIVNEAFSDEFEKAIEQKQVAQQNAEKANNDLKRIKIEAEQRVAQATAEAEAIRIQAQAVTQQGGSDYVQLQAIAKWNGSLPVNMIPNGSVPMINLNYGK